MDWLQNPWTIGIGTGIISSVVVGLILRFIFSKKDNREYLQKLTAANNEVLYAVRPLISEDIIPPEEVIDRVIKATSRKYAVNTSDMNCAEDLVGILTKEIMDSSFIPSENKMQLCGKLVAMPVKERMSLDSPAVRQFRFEDKYRRQMVMQLTLMTGLLTGVTVVALSFNNRIEFHFSNMKLWLILLPGIVVILSSLLVSFLKYLVMPRVTAIYKLPKKDSESTEANETENA